MRVETESPVQAPMSWTGRDGILILDSECGCVLEVNPILTELLGFSREKLRGRRIGDLGVFGDKAQAEALFEKVRCEGYAICPDLTLRTSGGDRIPVEFVGNSYLVDRKAVIQFNLCEKR
jgi:PAS domain S-box-containing protein